MSKLFYNILCKTINKGSEFKMLDKYPLELIEPHKCSQLIFDKASKGSTME